ncbi:MAG: hypothetical protein LBP59_20760 [Planctomycetaceae bacterium]|jgi:flagellin|nr:hypothetical protein [Planctomycetaceae bacterium]
MAIYFNTNLPETKGLLAFDRTTNKINDILQRLETGYRINSGKDDPTGLIKREGMRLDMKGMQAAINNSISGQNLLTVAENAMGSIANLITGDPSDTRDTGIIGILNSGKAGEIANAINQLATSINSISRTTIYNGKQIINGAYDYNTLANVTNTSTAGKIKDVKVTSADLSDGKPRDVAFTVTGLATQAGVNVAATGGGNIPVAASVKREIILTDGNGKSATVILDNSQNSTGVQYYTDELYDIFKNAVETSSTDLTVTGGNGADLQILTKEKGANKSLTVQVYDNGNPVNLSGSNPFSQATGTFNVTAATINSQGTDWTITGLEGTVVTNDNKINVYSNSIDFSANLADIVLNDKVNLKVTGGTSLQLGKDVSSAGKYNLGISTINSNNLVANDGTTLEMLRSLDYSQDVNKLKAQRAINDFATQIASERGRLGTIQKNVLVANQTNLENQLAVVTDEEASISNTDVALETSRLARQELIANSAMSAIQYARSFSQFAVSSLFQ